MAPGVLTKVLTLEKQKLRLWPQWQVDAHISWCLAPLWVAGSKLMLGSHLTGMVCVVAPDDSLWALQGTGFLVGFAHSPGLQETVDPVSVNHAFSGCCLCHM